jgi:hypothetical protein
LYIVVGTSCIPACLKMYWKSMPMKLAPCPWMQRIGLGYHDNQMFSKCMSMWLACLDQMDNLDQIFDGQDRALMCCTYRSLMQLRASFECNLDGSEVDNLCRWLGCHRMSYWKARRWHFGNRLKYKGSSNVAFRIDRWGEKVAIECKLKFYWTAYLIQMGFKIDGLMGCGPFVRFQLLFECHDEFIVNVVFIFEYRDLKLQSCA